MSPARSPSVQHSRPQHVSHASSSRRIARVALRLTPAAPPAQASPAGAEKYFPAPSPMSYKHTAPLPGTGSDVKVSTNPLLCVFSSSFSCRWQRHVL